MEEGTEKMERLTLLKHQALLGVVQGSLCAEVKHLRTVFALFTVGAPSSSSSESLCMEAAEHPIMITLVVFQHELYLYAREHTYS